MEQGAEVRMTLNYIIDSSREKFAESPAIGMAMSTSLTYSELHHQILCLAAYMQKEGVGKGDKVAILAENSDKWGVAYLAVVRLGAIVVPILPDLPESDVHHILGEMNVKILFTTQRQIEKVYELRKNELERIITLDDSQGVADVLKIDKYSEYISLADSFWEESMAEGEITFPDVDENDLATILYTSGTSGYSKAVMLSHKNLTSNAYAVSSLMDIPAGAVFLSILPMSHTYEFTCGFMLPLLVGGRIAYAGKTPTPAILQKLCHHEKPFAIFAVPLVLEKIYKKRVIPQVEKNKALSLVCKTSFGRKMIYKKIGARLLEFFGGNLQVMGVGGASLNPEVEKFLSEAQFPYLVGYGLTESSPLLAGGPAGDKTITLGSAGKPIPGVQVKIVDPAPDSGVGEIHAIGPNIMTGYYNDPEGTTEVISEDGWLATGDLGCLDEQGNLHIRGRSKNVIVLANGENVYPETIEHKYNAYSWVVEGLVVENNGRLDAWIYPDYEVVDEQTAGQSRSQRRLYIEKLLDEMRLEVNKQLPSSARVAKTFERREPFIKTATHKIKRYLYDGHAMVG